MFSEKLNEIWKYLAHTTCFLPSPSPLVMEIYALHPTVQLGGEGEGERWGGVWMCGVWQQAHWCGVQAARVLPQGLLLSELNPC